MSAESAAPANVAPATAAATQARIAVDAAHAPITLRHHLPSSAAGTARRGRPLLLLAAGATVTAIAYVAAPADTASEQVDLAVPQRATPKAPVTSTSVAALQDPVRAPVTGKAAANPFASATFVPPPPPAPPPPPPMKVVAPAPPPPPTAPPLPYTFVGLLEKGAGRPAAFVARGETLLVVSAGEVLDNTYRVEAVGAREVVFTYLPLGQKQVLNPAGGTP